MRHHDQPTMIEDALLPSPRRTEAACTTDGTQHQAERCCRSIHSGGGTDMSRGMPSMTALLGLLALAGYQNRDKLGELLKGATGNTGQPGAGGQQGPLGGLLGNLGGALAGGGVGGLLNGGLGELLDRFKQNGQGDTAEVLDRQGSQQGASAATAEAGHWSGCPGRAGTANGPVAGGTAGEAFARTSCGGRSIYAGRTDSELNVHKSRI